MNVNVNVLNWSMSSLLISHCASCYCAMLCTARYCHGKKVIRTSVHGLYVTLRYCDHIGWNTLTVMSPLISIGSLLFADTDIMDLLQIKHPKF